MNDTKNTTPVETKDLRDLLHLLAELENSARKVTENLLTTKGQVEVMAAAGGFEMNKDLAILLDGMPIVTTAIAESLVDARHGLQRYL